MANFNDNYMRILFSVTLICVAFLTIQPQANGQGNSASPKPKKVVSGGVLNGKAISKPQPAYPPIAKAAHASGTVTVQVLVDEDGNVISAKAVSGHPLLQQAAVNAAYQAKFSPTLLEGQKVKVSGVLTYNFVLEK
jgi:protein TonB